MDLDAFLQRLARDPERVVTRTVRQIPKELLRPGVRLSELKPRWDHVQGTPQDFVYHHIVGAGASEKALAQWTRQHPGITLPADLQELVRTANGIHLWANAATGRAYQGLAPIEEWQLARIKMYGAGANPRLIDDRYLAISYHQDGAAYVVLDTCSGAYFLMDVAAPNTGFAVGTSVEELLDWLWHNRIEPAAKS